MADEKSDSNCRSIKSQGLAQVAATSNWILPDGRSLKEAMAIARISSVQHVESKGDISEFITPESCLLLSRDEEQQNLCTVTLKADAGLISRILVVSEARILEVYGTNEEYLFTVRADFFDDFEGMMVYQADAIFNQPVPECTVKFAGLRQASQMWLYGFKVNLKDLPQTGAAIGTKASAQQLKNFLSMCETALPGAQKMATFMSACERRFSSDGKDADNKKDVDEQLKVFVTVKMDEMERRLTKLINQRMDLLERRQDEKLEQIIMLLKR